MAGSVGVGLGLYWFEPWQLFVDRTVREEAPGGAAGGATAAPAEERSEEGGAVPQPAGGPRVLSAGRFRSLEHGTSGVAMVLELPDGSRFVRLEDLATSNGPDLIVILSDTPATEDSWGAYDDGRWISLGELKGNIGDQNYRLPPDVDLSLFRSVVVWCRRFTVGFGAAPLDVG